MNKIKYIDNDRPIIVNCFLLLFFIYSVHYNFLPLKIPTSYFLILLFLYAWFINLCMHPRTIMTNKISLLICFTLIIWSLLSFIINQGKLPDTLLIRTFCLYLLIIITYPAILKIFFKNNIIFLLRTLGWIGLVNAFFIFGMLISPGFQKFYLSLLNDKLYSVLGSKEELLKSYMSLRMIGITGLSVYTTGFIQVFLAICYMLYISLINNSRKIHYIIILLISISAMIAARSSFVGLLFLFIFSTILFGIKNPYIFQQ